MTSVLNVEALRVTLSTERGPLEAVRGVSFSVAPTQTVCLVGESGCGKSTTALALMGLLPPSGRISAERLALANEDLLQVTTRRLNELRGNRMAMIFQEPITTLNPAYTIGKQLIEVHRRHKKSSYGEARDRAVHLLERVQIGSAARRLGQYPHQLSGGMRQRVVIAMALMCDPLLLIADEPTTALDVTIQTQILSLLSDLQSEFGVGLLLITHDLGIVARVADWVHVMYAGAIVESGTTADIFANPRHPYTQALLSCASIALPESGARQPLTTIPGTVPSLIGGITGCAFRNRCAFATAECAREVPWKSAGAHHLYRCILGPA